MARQNVPMKDVAACDKLRGGGKQPLIRRFPNRETCCESVATSCFEYIGTRRAPGEVKHLSTQRKRKNMFVLRFHATKARRVETKNESIP